MTDTKAADTTSGAEAGAAAELNAPVVPDPDNVISDAKQPPGDVAGNADKPTPAAKAAKKATAGSRGKGAKRQAVTLLRPHMNRNQLQPEGAEIALRPDQIERLKAHENPYLK